MMHGREKSDSAIVAEKPTNKVVFGHGGAGGAKGGGQGECEPAKHASDTVPKMRVKGVGAHTASSPSLTQGGSRMPELGLYGSLRGARGDSRPYRDSGLPPVFLHDIRQTREPDPLEKRSRS